MYTLEPGLQYRISESSFVGDSFTVFVALVQLRFGGRNVYGLVVSILPGSGKPPANIRLSNVDNQIHLYTNTDPHPFIFIQLIANLYLGNLY